jgi:hypothetical protein
MHYINRAPFEYVGSIFTIKSVGQLIKANINLALIDFLAGVYWFINTLKTGSFATSSVVGYWFACLCMVIRPLNPLLHNRLHIFLPVTVLLFTIFI